jgi:outer membrane protein TolC
MPPAEAEPAQWQPLALPSPADWLRQRPDLLAAETRLRAQALDVAAIRAEFLPRLTLGGSLGYLAGSVAGLSQAGALTWWLAPSLQLPVLDRGRIQARLDAASAQQREALLHYRQRVLLAAEEVENALLQIREGQTRLQALQARAVHAAQAETLARKRFDAGASDFLELLDAQRSAQQAQLGLAAALSQHRQQLAGLQRALGATYLPAPRA